MGAPEFVLGPNYENYRDIITAYASKGLRVLCFASYFGGVDGTDVIDERSDNISLPVPNHALDGAKTVPLVFILLQNPIREAAPSTFNYFKKLFHRK